MQRLCELSDPPRSMYGVQAQEEEDLIDPLPAVNGKFPVLVFWQHAQHDCERHPFSTRSAEKTVFHSKWFQISDSLSP